MRRDYAPLLCAVTMRHDYAPLTAAFDVASRTQRPIWYPNLSLSAENRSCRTVVLLFTRGKRKRSA
jgi:hypothetical protein